ncbi:MAG: DUF2169 domain-containing protein [Smithella sp.]
MKTIKPQKLSLQFKVYEEMGRCFFFPAVFLLFPFGNPAAIGSEVALWKLVAEKLGKDTILDMGMPKIRGEVLISGTCYTPAGKPYPACPVNLKIGNINKTLNVFGNRYWNKLGAISNPEPFTTMALTWTNAFGGDGYDFNPIGKGFTPINNNGKTVHPLPNIEDPRALIGSPNDKPLPAGFAPLDMTWKQRFSKVGTYDKKWLETRFPGYAADMDSTFLNTAPEDQWLQGFFAGNEAFTLEHMHPDEPVLSGQLPGLTARCFIRRKTAEPESLEEIAMRLETVHFLPDAKQGILIFRGGVEIATDDADDLSLAMAAAEKIGEPKALKHYQEVITKRLDKEMGAVYALRDSDLLPVIPEMSAVAKEISEMEQLLAREDLLRKNMRVRAEKKLAESREQIASLGVNPDDFVPATLPPEPPPLDMEKLDVAVLELEEMAKKAKADAILKKAEAEKQVRNLCSQQGLDYEKLLADAAKQQGGKPKFSAAQQMAQMKELQSQLQGMGVKNPVLDGMINDPAFEKKLQLAEEKIQEAYRKYAQHFSPARALSSEEALRLRETVSTGYASGASFAGADLTGADLSSLSLIGADFHYAILEGVNFTGADLTRADFSNAVLAGANLTGAKCLEGKFSGTNIGRAVLKDADLSGGLDMRNAVLAKSDLSGARFTGADLSGADLMECVFNKTDFSQVKAQQLTFISSDLKGLNCSGADLSKSIFIETDVTGVDFTGAKLVSAVFVTAQGKAACFQGADLENLRIVKDSVFEEADFSRAKLDRANLRGTNLTKCIFEQASLNDADLSECAIMKGNFYRATAKRAKFEKTDLTGANLVSINLMQGSLRKARFHGSDFQGANLYEVDFEKSKGDTRTDFRQANLKKTRMIGWEPTIIHY